MYEYGNAMAESYENENTCSHRGYKSSVGFAKEAKKDSGGYTSASQHDQIPATSAGHDLKSGESNLRSSTSANSQTSATPAQKYEYNCDVYPVEGKFDEFVNGTLRSKFDRTLTHAYSRLINNDSNRLSISMGMAWVVIITVLATVTVITGFFVSSFISHYLKLGEPISQKPLSVAQRVQYRQPAKKTYTPLHSSLVHYHVLQSMKSNDIVLVDDLFYQALQTDPFENLAEKLDMYNPIKANGTNDENTLGGSNGIFENATIESGLGSEATQFILTHMQTLMHLFKIEQCDNPFTINIEKNTNSVPSSTTCIVPAPKEYLLPYSFPLNAHFVRAANTFQKIPGKGSNQYHYILNNDEEFLKTFGAELISNRNPSNSKRALHGISHDSTTGLDPILHRSNSGISDDSKMSTYGKITPKYDTRNVSSMRNFEELDSLRFNHSGYGEFRNNQVLQIFEGAQGEIESPRNLDTNGEETSQKKVLLEDAVISFEDDSLCGKVTSLIESLRPILDAKQAKTALDFYTREGSVAVALNEELGYRVLGTGTLLDSYKSAKNLTENGVREDSHSENYKGDHEEWQMRFTAERGIPSLGHTFRSDNRLPVTPTSFDLTVCCSCLDKTSSGPDIVTNGRPIHEFYDYIEENARFLSETIDENSAASQESVVSHSTSIHLPPYSIQNQNGRSAAAATVHTANENTAPKALFEEVEAQPMHIDTDIASADRNVALRESLFEKINDSVSDTELNRLKLPLEVERILRPDGLHVMKKSEEEEHGFSDAFLLSKLCLFKHEDFANEILSLFRKYSTDKCLLKISHRYRIPVSHVQLFRVCTRKEATNLRNTHLCRVGEGSKAWAKFQFRSSSLRGETNNKPHEDAYRSLAGSVNLIPSEAWDRGAFKIGELLKFIDFGGGLFNRIAYFNPPKSTASLVTTDEETRAEHRESLDRLQYLGQNVASVYPDDEPWYFKEGGSSYAHEVTSSPTMRGQSHEGQPAKYREAETPKSSTGKVAHNPSDRLLGANKFYVNKNVEEVLGISLDDIYATEDAADSFASAVYNAHLHYPNKIGRAVSQLGVKITHISKTLALTDNIAQRGQISIYYDWCNLLMGRDFGSLSSGDFIEQVTEDKLYDKIYHGDARKNRKGKGYPNVSRSFDVLLFDRLPKEIFECLCREDQIYLSSTQTADDFAKFIGRATKGVQRLFAEMARLVRPGGYIVLSGHPSHTEKHGPMNFKDRPVPVDSKRPGERITAPSDFLAKGGGGSKSRASNNQTFEEIQSGLLEKDRARKLEKLITGKAKHNHFHINPHKFDKIHLTCRMNARYFVQFFWNVFLKSADLLGSLPLSREGHFRDEHRAFIYFKALD